MPFLWDLWIFFRSQSKWSVRPLTFALCCGSRSCSPSGSSSVASAGGSPPKPCSAAAALMLSPGPGQAALPSPSSPGNSVGPASGVEAGDAALALALAPVYAKPRCCAARARANAGPTPALAAAARCRAAHAPEYPNRPVGPRDQHLGCAAENRESANQRIVDVFKSPASHVIVSSSCPPSRRPSSHTTHTPHPHRITSKPSPKYLFL